MSDLILYTTDDGLTRVEMWAEGGSLWLSQAEIGTLFQTTPQNITQHVKAIYSEGEADPEATCKSGLQVRQEGDILHGNTQLTFGTAVQDGDFHGSFLSIGFFVLQRQ